MARSAREEAGRGNRSGREDDREFVGAGVLVKLDPKLSGKTEIDTTLYFISLHSVSLGRISRQKGRRDIIVSRADYIKIAVLAGREMKSELLTRLHCDGIAGANSVAAVLGIDLQPVTPNFMGRRSKFRSVGAG